MPACPHATCTGLMGVEFFQGALHYRCAIEGMAETAGHPSESIHLLRRLTEWMTEQQAAGPADGMPGGGMLGGMPGGGMLGGGMPGGGMPGGGGPVRRHLRGVGELRIGAAAFSFNASAPHAQSDFDSGVFCDPRRRPSVCPAEYPVCSYFDETVNYGVTSFDDVRWAAVAILQGITFDGWSETMCDPTSYILHLTSHILHLTGDHL